MNLQILKWLLAHRDVLTKVLEIAKGWRQDLSVIEKWDIADRIARIIIPVITPDDVKSMYGFQDETLEAFSVGQEYAALGVDWQQLVAVLLPILRMVLMALETLVDE